jgi:hypothetical protein
MLLFIGVRLMMGGIQKPFDLSSLALKISEVLEDSRQPTTQEDKPGRDALTRFHGLFVS